MTKKHKRSPRNAMQRQPATDHRRRVEAELRRLDHDPLAAAELAEIAALRQPEGQP